jgi:hypothetical protein
MLCITIKSLMIYRGAGDSDGKTSWTGKAETQDFASLVGFTIYFLHHLRMSIVEDDSTALTPILSVDASKDLSTSAGGSEQKPLLQSCPLLLGGYSYGSLVLARLPNVGDIVKRLHEAPMGTTPAEIILRARTLAKQTATALEEARRPGSPRGRSLMPSDALTSPAKHASPVVMGGEETDASDRRRSRDSRRSIEVMREMPHRLKAHLRRVSDPAVSKHRYHQDEQEQRPPTAEQWDLPRVDVGYLLISPVILPFSTMLSPPGSPSLPMAWQRGKADGSPGALFLQHRTLAIFGAKDAFTSARRLRAWAEKQGADSPGFSWVQVAQAGHFWREDGAMTALQDHLLSWHGSRG